MELNATKYLNYVHLIPQLVSAKDSKDVVHEDNFVHQHISCSRHLTDTSKTSYFHLY